MEIAKEKTTTNKPKIILRNHLEHTLNMMFVPL
jgi:hypothetical protein